jgi:GT2 family glycosyltransferase
MVLNRNFGRAVTIAPSKKRDRKHKLLIGTLGVNCTEYTRRCIDTVQTTCNDVTFLYIDNGSKPANVEDLKTWKKKNPDIDEFLMAFNGCNAGVAVGWNQIIRFGLRNGVDSILVCNNDIAFGRHTIDGMIDAFDRLVAECPETVMVTATNQTKTPSQLDNIKQEWKNSEHPDFSCFMIRPDFVEKIGFICEDYKPAFFEDNDTHWRILMSGYKAWGTNWAPYSHIASRTRHGNPDLVPHLRFRENKIQFMRNMLTDTVDQEVAVARYRDWLERYPDVKHPSVDAVLTLARSQGLVTDRLVAWLKNLNAHTFQG